MFNLKKLLDIIEKDLVSLMDQIIRKHNKFYYENSSPVISDSEYDKLKKKVLNLEKKHNFLKSNFSPSKIVGFKPSKNFAKYKHREKMLSLSNAFDEEDLINFEKKIFNFLNEKADLNYSVEPKIDGISASLTYKMGFLFMVYQGVMEKKER